MKKHLIYLKNYIWTVLQRSVNSFDYVTTSRVNVSFLVQILQSLKTSIRKFANKPWSIAVVQLEWRRRLYKGAVEVIVNLNYNDL